VDFTRVIVFELIDGSEVKNSFFKVEERRKAWEIVRVADSVNRLEVR
jgi:hypothetical protein